MAYPFALKISLVKSLYYLLYNLYNHISSENLVLDQPKIFHLQAPYINFFEYMPDWYQKKLTKRQRGQERKNCFVRASHKL